jgi:SAM-dependent methyltransferase
MSMPSLGPAVNQITDELHEFYCLPRSISADGPLLSRYEIWERGEAFHDSVTPSTYCPGYRAHMVLKIASLTSRQGKVFSIGCGNAFVEANLVARGLHVQAIDCNAEAVELATAKGVDAVTANYWTLPTGHFATFDIVYADGLLGHFYRPDDGLNHFFEALIALKPRPGAWLVLSNDAPLQRGSVVAPHEGVNGFWLLSRDCLTEVLTRFGLAVWESYYFPYERPVSGLRNRTICIARVRDCDV